MICRVSAVFDVKRLDTYGRAIAPLLLRILQVVLTGVIRDRTKPKRETLQVGRADRLMMMVVSGTAEKPGRFTRSATTFTTTFHHSLLLFIDTNVYQLIIRTRLLFMMN